MPDPRESPMDLTFPTRGVNVATEYELQPVGTTPVGANVRTYEPSSSRGRGGARPGLFKLLLDRVNGNAPVQHLNFIVTQSGTAMLTDFESSFADELGYPTMPDPATNNRSEFPNGPWPAPAPPLGGTAPPTAPPPNGTAGGGPPGGPNAPGGAGAARNPPRVIRTGGSGVQLRRNGPAVPPPPPPPPGGFRLICRTFERDPSYFDPDEIGQAVVCECNDPSRPPYTVTFPNQQGSASTTIAGGSLPTVGDMNAMLQEANPSSIYDPPFYTGVVQDVDSGPC